MKMTKKARFIENLDTLSADEKKEITDFFTKYPNYENLIDWNFMFLTYRDFEKVLSLAENSSRSIKRKAKADPRLLFEKYNCEIIKQTEDFLMVIPLDWECAVFFNSFECGGEGARWCIGDSNDAAHWNNYLAKKNVFFLIFFVNKHPVYKRKAVIQYHVKDGKYTLWLQDNTESNQIFGPLNTAIELIKNSAKRSLGRICRKDYILKDSVLKKCYDRKNINIPAGVTAIGSFAFYGCENLTAIDIPNGVTAIGFHAFSRCENLTTINIPNSITVIDDDPFYGCENLSSITVGKQNKRFSGIDGILFDKIKNRILHFPTGKQDSCYTIPAGVNSIGDHAFSDCKNLVTINIPDSVTVIGDDVFPFCKNLRSITVGKQNQRFSGIDGVLFDKIENRILRYPAGKQDSCYTIPVGVNSIGDHAFSGCENLVTIDIPDSVTVIGNGVFLFCKNLRSITVGKQNQRFSGIDGVLFDKIENRILRFPAGKPDFCYTIPAGVNSIGDVFYGCENLVTINIPDSVTVIGDGVFSYCKNLRSIIVGKQNQRFSGIDGVLFDKIENKILRYPAEKQDACYTIPAGVNSIGDHAFSGCKNLVTINIPDSVTVIEDNPFYGCENLKEINNLSAAWDIFLP